MRVDLEQWTNEKIQVDNKYFIGTKRGCRDKGKYVVDIIMVSVIAQTISYLTDEDAKKIENEIWEVMKREG